jgi:hypothetical protein
MKRCMIAVTGVLWLIGAVGRAAPVSDDTLVEKTWAQLSDREVSDWGQAALAIRPAKWKHGETAHFIIHYARFGQLIATRSEKFYGRIRQFFGNRPDLFQGRKSHIFAVHDPNDWRTFVQQVGLSESTRGVTRGNEFFYFTQGERTEFDYEGRVQAHEMTHLIFNRFFAGRLPLWLNEGVAEYFAQRTNIAEFRRYMRASQRFDPDRLFDSGAYPANQIELAAFYAEAAAVVDFLTFTPERRALLPQCIDAVAGGGGLAAVVSTYGYRDVADFKKAYERYRLLY